MATASGFFDASAFVAIVVVRGVDGFKTGIGERMDQEERSLLAAIASDLTWDVAWSVAREGMFGRKVVRAPN